LDALLELFDRAKGRRQTSGSHLRCDRRVRIVHLVSHPIQYFAPVYRELAMRPEVELTVYFLSDLSLHTYADPGFGAQVAWDVDLTGGYRYRLLPDAQGRSVRGGFLQAPHWDVLRELATTSYDVLWLHGYHHTTMAAAVAIGRGRGRRVMVREEQTMLERRPRYKQAAKEVILRPLLSGVDGLYLGEESRRFFRHFGVRESRLFRVPYAVDSEYLNKRAAELAPKRALVRHQLGIDDDAPAILFVGKLVGRKAPGTLLAAFGQIRRQHPCWLVFAGDGEERPALEAEIARQKIPNVRILGFVNQTGLPEIYSAADIFVLPSLFNETWGVVVNEAMTFGLPVVLSDHVGSAPDLVRPGWNGFVTRAGDVEDLSKSLDTLVGSRELRERLGNNGRALIADYSVSASADALVAAALAR
jgi:glycosyltransferase involved in cell wall biosynthesis